MGKVFSWEEIQEGLVPSQVDFRTAKSIILRSIGEYHQAGHGIGARIFGSVAHGTFNRRSDLDVLVIYDDENDHYFLNELVGKVYDRTHVLITPMEFDSKLASRGFNTVDTMFDIHLHNVPSKGNLAGRDPLDILKPDPTPVEEVHKNYIKQKLRRLRERPGPNGEGRMMLLQRTLELPANLGRRTVFTDVTLGAVQADILDDRKDNVYRLYREIFSDPEHLVGFNTIISADQIYTEALDEAWQRRNEPSYRSYYEELLTEIEDGVVPIAIKFTKEVAQTYLDVLAQREIYLEGVNPERG